MKNDDFPKGDVGGLLIIDDFGLQPLWPAQSEDMYELIAERSLKASFIFTSNRSVDAWIELFSNSKTRHKKQSLNKGLADKPFKELTINAPRLPLRSVTVSLLENLKFVQQLSFEERF